jgi:hypothetical protein
MTGICRPGASRPTRFPGKSRLFVGRLPSPDDFFNSPTATHHCIPGTTITVFKSRGFPYRNRSSWKLPSCGVQSPVRSVFEFRNSGGNHTHLFLFSQPPTACRWRGRKGVPPEFVDGGPATRGNHAVSKFGTLDSRFRGNDVGNLSLALLSIRGTLRLCVLA